MNDRNKDMAPEERELLESLGTSFESQKAKHAGCPAPDLLLASQAGVLNEETAGKVASHLERCTFCRILLRDLSDPELASARPKEEDRIRERVFGAKQAAAKSTHAVVAVRKRPWLLSVTFATAACAVLAVVLWMRFHPGPQPAPRVVTITAPREKPSTPSVFVWEKLPVRLQASTILVLRGGPQTSQSTYTSQLTTALVFYQDNQYNEAVQHLAKVVKAFPNGVEAQLYLGISRLAVAQNAEAVEPLCAAQKLGPEQFREDATWFLALAYQRLHDAPHASAELQKLCSGKNDYAARACAGVQELSALPEAKPTR